MDAKTSTQIINAAGGDKAFAKLLGLSFDIPGVQQRVNNWKRRGIPSQVQLEHREAIEPLLKQIATPTDRKAA